MATTVSAAFNTLVRDAAGSAAEISSAASHREEIRKRLNWEFDDGVVNLEPIGSFGNGTNVRGYSDADYLAWIKYDRCPENSVTLLNRVRQTLADRYPATTVNVRTPSVAVRFAGNRERVEIVPARFGRSAHEEIVYEIAAGAGDWMETSPAIHKAYVHRHHQRLNDLLKPLIRLVKLWNFAHDLGLSSFYLEMRTTKLAESENVLLYPWDVAATLKYLKDVELCQMHDPTELSGYIRSASETKRSAALSKLESHALWAKWACEAEAKGDHRSAFDYWRLVFPGWFPSYTGT